jgi:hypothetical protein
MNTTVKKYPGQAIKVGVTGISTAPEMMNLQSISICYATYTAARMVFCRYLKGINQVLFIENKYFLYEIHMLACRRLLRGVFF